MRKAKYTDVITKLATVPMAIERYKISRKTLLKHADNANAIVRFGKSVRIDVEKMDKYISNSNEVK